MSNRFVEQGLKAPVNLTWEVTLACNLRCRHCLSSSGHAAPRELDTREALALVGELHEAGVFQLNFGGGEPFLRPDFDRILQACHDRGVMTCISTNGTLLDGPWIDRLSRSGLVALQVSLDGARAETCDGLRGAGTSERALRALKLLASSPIPTSINAVLTASNASEVPELYDLARSLGVSLRVSRFRPSGRGAANWAELRPSAAQLVAFSAWLSGMGDVRTGDSFFSLTPQQRQGLGLNLCGAAKLTCCVGPEGDVYPCAFLQRDEFRAGALRESAFQEIWDDSAVFRSFRRLRIHSCEECQRFDRCHGGCPAVAYHLGRGVAGGDPECLVNCVSALDAARAGPGTHARRPLPDDSVGVPSMMFRYLFSPIRLGRVELKNRISFQPHLTNFAVDALPSERHLHYWGERARGGAALIITEEMSVHPTDRAYEKLIEVFQPEVVPRFRKITDRVHQYDAKIFAQLNHNGQQCDGTLSRLPVFAPSPVPDVLFREVPKEMEVEDIEEVARYFAKSAVYAREGGFDGIELQYGHSSLARQFLSPLTNRRQDEFGGSLENRMKVPVAFVEAVRKAVGRDFTVGIRLCADEMIPWGGLTLADVQEIAVRFEATGLIDFMDLSIGTFFNLYLVEGSMHTPLGYTIPLAAGIRSSVKLPVFCTGRINDPVMAEKVLANGQADIIGMCRALICDPFLPKKAQEARIEDIRYCIGDNQGCIGRMGMNKLLGCIQNPAVGLEKDWCEGSLKPAAVKKKVMVVGGGPAGLWAAKMAGRRGHRVDLYERREELGGQVLIGRKGAGRDEFGVIVRNEKDQVDKAGVTVHLGVEVTPELVEREKPDAVVVATGSVPSKNPGMAGADGPAVYNVWQVLQGEADVGEKVCLVDGEGHHRATSTAEYMANQGKTVHILCPSLFVGAELGPVQDLYLTRQRLLQKGCTFTPDIAVIEISGEAGGKMCKGINVYSNVMHDFGPYDSVVLAVAQEVDDRLYKALKGRVKELCRIGDCVAPRKVDMAIWEGHKVGREL